MMSTPLLLALILLASCFAITTQQQVAASDTSARVQVPDERAELVKEVHENLKTYEDNARWWGRWYLFALVVGILFSAAAGVVIKADFASKWTHQKDIAFLLSALAAAVGTTSATDAWGLNARWTANRASRVATDQLRLDATNPNFPADSIRARLKVNAANHEEWRSGKDPKPK